MDELHLELDALAGALWDQSELSSPLVFVSEGEPPEHVRKLMATLGVRVEVRPVTQTHLTVREAARGRAAMDHRTSLANVLRREQAGDEPVTCADCGTEIDVTAIAHATSCPRYQPPAEPKEKPASGPMERGRNGRMRSTSERGANGEITGGELQRRHEEFLDAAPTVSTCAVPGCEEWRFEGSAAGAREAFAAHRLEVHPELVDGGPRRYRRKARVAETPSAPAPPAADSPPKTREPWSTKRKWNSDSIIAAIKRFAEENGRPPTADEWRHVGEWTPNYSAVVRFCGSWGDAIEAAGFPRPVRGGQPGRAKGARKTSASSPSTEVAKKEERQQVPVVWQVKVAGTGLRYRTVDEALVAADEIEHDGERVAREARVAGQEGKADQAIDAARELAGKIRAAASGEPAESSEPEPLAQQPPAVGAGSELTSPGPASPEPGSGSDLDDAPPGGELELPDPEKLTREPELWISRLETEAARLNLRASAYRSIALSLRVLEETAA